MANNTTRRFSHGFFDLIILNDKFIPPIYFPGRLFPKSLTRTTHFLRRKSQNLGLLGGQVLFFVSSLEVLFVAFPLGSAKNIGKRYFFKVGFLHFFRYSQTLLKPFHHRILQFLPLFVFLDHRDHSSHLNPLRRLEEHLPSRLNKVFFFAKLVEF